MKKVYMSIESDEGAGVSSMHDRFSELSANKMSSGISENMLNL